MDVTRFTHPIDLRAVSITDPFWQRETELVRREVIPYQWEALNDRIPRRTPTAATMPFPMTPRTRMRTSSTASCFRILTSASGLKPSAIP